MRKIYGNTNTHLTLTEIAQRVCNESDPMDIAEHETDDGYWYEIRTDYTDGFRGHYTEQEVNEFLESMMDDEWVFTLDTDEPERWGDGAENGMEITFGEVKRLAQGWDVPVEDLLKELR